MALSDGCNHVALVTADIDRFIAFYTSVFEATVLVDLTEGPLRHALLDLGNGFCLHPFARTDSATPHGVASTAMFDRGHLDHLAINVSDPDAFAELRRRLVAAGASDGELTDFGLVRSVSFEDPDGMDCEIACWADGPARTLDEAGREAYEAVPA